MPELLTIRDGPTIRLDGEPRQGTRHRLLSGALAVRDKRVVVKVESIPGALERERTALAWLWAERPGLAPEPIAFGEARLAGEPITCLVTEHLPGVAPTTLAGWRRMGAAVAQLAELAHPDRGLPVLDHDRFVRAHRERLSELGARLDPFVRDIPDWERLNCGTASTPLVLTHGDPGPGNYLDAGASGCVIDWEDAQVAPLGLDLGRLIFIAMLGSGPAGYPAREPRARASAATAGYLAAAERRWLPSSDELRWWVAVAGVQFVHRRWQLGGRPAPWEQAARALTTALAAAPTF